MKKICIATHGHFASGIKSSIDILFGASEQITVIDAYVDERKVEDLVDEFYERVDAQDQVILMSDLYGGSVNQILFQYINKPNTFLIAGVNLALVLEIAVDPTDMTKVKIEQLINDARNAMILVEDITLEPSDEEAFF